MKEIRIFSPATIANVSCGFDVLGLCLDNTGDEMVIRKVTEPGIRITKIEGQQLPMEAEKNVAGVAAIKLLQAVEHTGGFEIEIYKKIKPGSGIGSSAASAAGAVFGINKLLNEPFNANELVGFAMEGEALASGAKHADNVAPALLGGFTLVKGYEPLETLKLNTPSELYAAVIHPQIEVKTADARSVLKQTVSLKLAVKQWGNLAALVSALYTEDYDLISRSLTDEIVEPMRSPLIPGYSKVKEAAKLAGALGSGISGSGPSIFALTKGRKSAEAVAAAMGEVYQEIGVDFDLHVSAINQEGIKILATK
ncbi:homoserine kinase [Robertkochia solimangrovi]|uniref:homoserine kinase n=1 Tax=Robertkochia solimangrovi TaxID=2213046 RepID=UPI00117DF38B|nr:homoserine kinase [Robertkochia solimangrovi]TRZ42907.1 homoserine kinase [Robertkochia solimangrovi]